MLAFGLSQGGPEHLHQEGIGVHDLEETPLALTIEDPRLLVAVPGVCVGIDRVDDQVGERAYLASSNATFLG